MPESAKAAVSPPDATLWHALQSHVIGPPGEALDFTGRLARENGWTRARADRVVLEYRRFAYLAATAPHPVTPSDVIDQAWHLHLTYSRDYWERFCPLLGRALHHGPTVGGAAEEQRFFAQYADTLRAYERVFGPPPADLWPPAAQRLRDDPRARRVHPRNGLVVPWWVVRLLLLCVCLALAWRWFA